MRSIESLNMEEKAELVRLMLDKKSGGCDIDWRDIVQDFNLDCSPETLRKAGVGVKLAEDAGMDFLGNGDGTLTAMDGYAERQKLYDLRRGVRKDLREYSRSELLRETIRDAIKGLPKIEIGTKTTICPLWGDIEWDKTNKDLVVGIGDFHYGAEYTVEGLYGETLNQYNSEVFVRRMEQLISEIVNIAKMHSPQQITVMIVGDMLDGLLRASQISRLEFGVVDSAIKLSETMCQWLARLAEETSLPVRVYAVRGNHGEIRPLGTKAGQFPEENMERVVMHYIHERFSMNPYVLVQDNDAPLHRMVDICGYKFLLLHGQGDDIEKIARDHQVLYNDRIDVFMVGHLHKSQTFAAGAYKSGNILIERVPSICGIDPYAQSKGYGSPAGATVILVEKGYGRRCVYPIVLK